jgi:hypothetical protein
MTRKEALERAREVLAGKTRSYVEAARLLAEFIIDEEKQRPALAEAPAQQINPPEGVLDADRATRTGS